ncbi:N-acetyl sugar amidotransferase [Helicobacter sp. MIT 11-5569]|uniref:N-acetyl sugar amidotransferase n=1 Tax=Helicobacter sp. MIT 11-5569 TaxID=1548151 RepID=UPI00068D1369|nr:N-acetyl sugar amidotransferase [Helicobacter sp. MIT 11-5569]TLD81363.1 N-acetyl sugar amidotransferase [Helicobacter sp. MIT 11-5569]
MEYQVCKRCVMDTTDATIYFDEKGVCNHCHKFDSYVLPQIQKCTQDKLDAKIAQIKKECKNQAYDAVIGLSGGVDSSYLLHYMKIHYGLRILAVHVDAGWNTKVANDNIQKLVNQLKIPLHTITIDWEEMRKLQVAFLRSGVANCDAPQDMAFFASVYGYTSKNNIRYVLSGFNLATESIFPISWVHSSMDSIQMKDIYKRYGGGVMKTFPIAGFFKYYFYYPFIKKMQVISPLNYINYSKKQAVATLSEIYDWQNYGEKHDESIWTRFFQSYFLMKKFGYDVRKPYYSSSILSGEMTRDEAINRLKPFSEEALAKDLEFVLDKLQLTLSQWQEIMETPKKDYTEYANNHKLYLLKQKYFDIFFPHSYFWVTD